MNEAECKRIAYAIDLLHAKARVELDYHREILEEAERLVDKLIESEATPKNSPFSVGDWIRIQGHPTLQNRLGCVLGFSSDSLWILALNRNEGEDLRTIVSLPAERLLLTIDPCDEWDVPPAPSGNTERS